MLSKALGLSMPCYGLGACRAAQRMAGHQFATPDPDPQSEQIGPCANSGKATNTTTGAASPNQASVAGLGESHIHNTNPLRCSRAF